MSYQSRTFAWNVNNAPATIRGAIEKSITRWYVNGRVKGGEGRNAGSLCSNSVERVSEETETETVEGCLSRVRDLWQKGCIWPIFFKCWKFRSRLERKCSIRVHFFEVSVYIEYNFAWEYLLSCLIVIKYYSEFKLNVHIFIVEDFTYTEPSMTRYVISWFFKNARILDIHSHGIHITCKTEYPHFHRSKSNFYLILQKFYLSEEKLKVTGVLQRSRKIPNKNFLSSKIFTLRDSPLPRVSFEGDSSEENANVRKNGTRISGFHAKYLIGCRSAEASSARKEREKGSAKLE